MRKGAFLLPLAVVAAAATMWAAAGPLPLASPPTPVNPKLAAASTPANGGDTMSQGPCTGTAGQAGLLSKPVTPTSTSYQITYKEGGGQTSPACVAWMVDGNYNGTGTVTASGKDTETLTSDPIPPGHTVTVFVVNHENGGKWDQFSWGTGVTNGNNTVTFAPGCTASNGPEKLLFNPSPYGASVSITYTDEWAPHCYVWLVDGQIRQVNNAPPQQTSQTISFQQTPADAGKPITLDIVDGDHGGDWDQYTWTMPDACHYPPSAHSHLSGVTANSKGEVTGTLTYNNCPVGKGHKVTETLTKGGPQMVDTTDSGTFKFGGKPEDAFPVTISFIGDSSLPSSDNTWTCPPPRGSACTSS